MCIASGNNYVGQFDDVVNYNQDGDNINNDNADVIYENDDDNNNDDDDNNYEQKGNTNDGDDDYEDDYFPL